MNKIAIAIFTILFFTQCNIALKEKEDVSKYAAYAGPVNDEETAMKIAEAIWVPIYGKDIYDQKPFVAVLKGDTVWVVEGTLPMEVLGGTAYIEIQKSDGKVLKVTHGK